MTRPLTPQLTGTDIGRTPLSLLLPDDVVPVAAGPFSVFDPEALLAPGNVLEDDDAMGSLLTVLHEVEGDAEVELALYGKYETEPEELNWTSESVDAKYLAKESLMDGPGRVLVEFFYEKKSEQAGSQRIKSNYLDVNHVCR